MHAVVKSCLHVRVPMQGSDMVVLTRGGAAGAPLTVTDLWSDEFAAPEEDTQQVGSRWR